PERTQHPRRETKPMGPWEIWAEAEGTGGPRGGFPERTVMTIGMVAPPHENGRAGCFTRGHRPIFRGTPHQVRAGPFGSERAGARAELPRTNPAPRPRLPTPQRRPRTNPAPRPTLPTPRPRGMTQVRRGVADRAGRDYRVGRRRRDGRHRPTTPAR